MIKAKLTGLPSEINQITEDLQKIFNVVSVSNIYKNRNSSYVRVYVEFEVKLDKSYKI